MVANEPLFLECAASCHALRLRLEEDDKLVYVSFLIDAFYAGQESWLSRWCKRIAIAATALLGRGYQFEDIVLEEDAIPKLLAWCQASQGGMFIVTAEEP